MLGMIYIMRSEIHKQLYKQLRINNNTNVIPISNIWNSINFSVQKKVLRKNKI